MEIAGDVTWITVLFIVLGAATTSGAGFQAFFRPAERSPKFAQAAFRYDELLRETRTTLGALLRDLKSSGSGEKSTIHYRTSLLVRRPTRW
jgi:hypothetical protein